MKKQEKDNEEGPNRWFLLRFAKLLQHHYDRFPFGSPQFKRSGTFGCRREQRWLKSWKPRLKRKGSWKRCWLAQRGEGCGWLNYTLSVYNLPYKWLGEQMFPVKQNRMEASTLALTWEASFYLWSVVIQFFFCLGCYIKNYGILDK